MLTCGIARPHWVNRDDRVPVGMTKHDFRSDSPSFCFNHCSIQHGRIVPRHHTITFMLSCPKAFEIDILFLRTWFNQHVHCGSFNSYDLKKKKKTYDFDGKLICESWLHVWKIVNDFIEWLISSVHLCILLVEKPIWITYTSVNYGSLLLHVLTSPSTWLTSV